MNGFRIPKSIAISWYFAHHAGHNGYKQILVHTKPQAVVGIDERQPPAVDRWHRAYPWLYEFRALFIHRRNACEVLHILYGETYFRFSPWLFGSVPVVVTFHQPPQLLLRRLTAGDETGRVSRVVHAVTRRRFRKISAAIIISEAQREVLEQFVPADRIHLIPLGASTLPLIEAESRLRCEPDPLAILTVGNWLRDWGFYFDFVDYCRNQHPDWRFRLVNRKLPSVWHQRVQEASNLVWLRDLDDEPLLQEYAAANCLFLPFLEATGNNTVNEALAMGCPVISNVDLGVPDEEAIVTRCEASQEAFSSAIARWQDASAQQRGDLRERSHRAVRSLDWSIVGAKTLDLYQSLL
jgi:glycosyltransferase involved in cell wall biosynthesis